MKSQGCLKRLRGIDIYAKPINLTYKGKEKFKSILGGFISLCLLLFILSLFLYKLKDLIQRNQTSIKKNTLVSVSNSYSAPHDLSAKNITIAFKLANFYGENIEANPHYGSFIFKQFVITQHINDTDGTSYRTFNTYIVPFSQCKLNKNVFYYNEEEALINGIESFYCPDWQNLTIQGNWNSPQYQGLTLVFERCYNSTCANDTEFDAWIRPILVNEIIISQFFDVADYTTPIRTFLDDMFVSLVQGKSLYTATHIQKNEVKLYDSITGLFDDSQVDYFYTKAQDERFIADIEYGPGKGLYFYQDFILDNSYDTYERKVYTIVGVLQDVGGFYNALFFGGLIIYSQFQATIYITTLISKLYYVEVGEKIRKHQKKRKNTSRTKIEALDNSRLNDFESMDPESQTRVEQNSKNEKEELSNNQLIDAFTQKSSLSSSNLRSVQSYLLNLLRVKFTSYEILSYVFRRICSCCRSNSTKQKNLIKQTAYRLGKQQIFKELDIVNVMTKMRNLECLIHLLLNPKQINLLGYQRKNLIDFEQDEEPHSSKKQKFDHQQEVLHKILVKQQQLNDSLEPYKFNENLGDIDRKLLIGLVSQENRDVKSQSIVRNEGGPREKLTQKKTSKPISTSQHSSSDKDNSQKFVISQNKNSPKFKQKSDIIAKQDITSEDDVSNLQIYQNQKSSKTKILNKKKFGEEFHSAQAIFDSEFGKRSKKKAKDKRSKIVDKS